MTDSPANRPPGFAYLLLRNSMKLFNKPWQQLSTPEQAAAQREATEEFRLQQLVLQTDEAVGVILDPAILDQAVGLIRKRFIDPQSFANELQAHGLNEATLRQAVADELRVDGILSIIGQQGGQASEEEVADYYQTHSERFRSPELRKARHILITVNDDFPDNTRARARQRIEEVFALLEATPGRFDELVQSRSECPSVLQNGELGVVPEGKLLPPLNQALFALEAGTHSSVLESHLGFHIVRCEAVQPAATLSFAEAKPRIQALLNRKRQQVAQKKWLETLTHRSETSRRGGTVR